MKTVFGSAPEESDQHFKVCALRTDLCSNILHKTCSAEELREKGWNLAYSCRQGSSLTSIFSLRVTARRQKEYCI